MNLEITNLSLGIDSKRSEAVMEKMESMDEVMKGINSWNDVVDYA
jgi:hypothetical protein